MYVKHFNPSAMVILLKQNAYTSSTLPSAPSVYKAVMRKCIKL